MLNEELLVSYIYGFYGYGDLSAPIWFIGMEEADGKDEDEVSARLVAWDSRGRQPVEDVARFHAAFGQYDRFEAGAALQSTWAKLIRILLVTQRVEPTTELQRAFQMERLGRRGGDCAILELLPLPKPSRRKWLYDAWFVRAELQTIDAYEKWILSSRIEGLKHLIVIHKPKAVVFYGLGFKEHWKIICGSEFGGEIYPLRAHVGAMTSYMLLPHPVAHGRISALYDAAGFLLRSILPGK